MDLNVRPSNGKKQCIATDQTCRAYLQILPFIIGQKGTCNSSALKKRVILSTMSVA